MNEHIEEKEIYLQKLEMQIKNIENNKPNNYGELKLRADEVEYLKSALLESQNKTKELEFILEKEKTKINNYNLNKSEDHIVNHELSRLDNNIENNDKELKNLSVIYKKIRNKNEEENNFFSQTDNVKEEVTEKNLIELINT